MGVPHVASACPQPTARPHADPPPTKPQDRRPPSGTLVSSPVLPGGASRRRAEDLTAGVGPVARVDERLGVQVLPSGSLVEVETGVGSRGLRSLVHGAGGAVLYRWGFGKRGTFIVEEGWVGQPRVL